MLKRCPCSDTRTGGVSCGATLTFGDYANLRHDRARMDPAAEATLRLTELQDAFSYNPLHPRVRIKLCTGTQYVCIKAYININGLPDKSVRRKWQKVVSGGVHNSVGRPPQTTQSEDDRSHFAVASKPVSATTFKRVWDWWLKEYRVRVRQKKNVSSKCEGTQLLKL